MLVIYLFVTYKVDCWICTIFFARYLTL